MLIRWDMTISLLLLISHNIHRLLRHLPLHFLRHFWKLEGTNWKFFRISCRVYTYFSVTFTSKENLYEFLCLKWLKNEIKLVLGILKRFLGFIAKNGFFANWNNSIKIIVFIILSNFLLLEPNLLKATIVFWIHGILFYKKSWVCSSVSNYFHDGVVVTWTTTRHHILLVISLSQ